MNWREFGINTPEVSPYQQGYNEAIKTRQEHNKGPTYTNSSGYVSYLDNMQTPDVWQPNANRPNPRQPMRGPRNQTQLERTPGSSFMNAAEITGQTLTHLRDVYQEPSPTRYCLHPVMKPFLGHTPGKL